METWKGRGLKFVELFLYIYPLLASLALVTPYSDLSTTPPQSKRDQKIQKP